MLFANSFWSTKCLRDNLSMTQDNHSVTTGFTSDRMVDRRKGFARNLSIIFLVMADCLRSNPIIDFVEDDQTRFGKQSSAFPFAEPFGQVADFPFGDFPFQITNIECDSNSFISAPFDPLSLALIKVFDNPSSGRGLFSARYPTCFRLLLPLNEVDSAYLCFTRVSRDQT